MTRRQDERAKTVHELACHRERTHPGHDSAVARWAQERLDCQVLRLYFPDPIRSRLFYVTSHPSEPPPSFALNIDEVILGKAVTELRPTEHQFTSQDRNFDGYPPQLRNTDGTLWLIPVKNTWNSNQVLAVMAAFYTDGQSTKRRLNAIAADVAIELEEGMRDRILVLGHALDRAIRGIERLTPRNASKALATVLLESTPANRCEIYLKDKKANLYAVRATGSTEFKKLGEEGAQDVQLCLQANREVLQVAPLDAPYRSLGSNRGHTVPLSCLAMLPIRDHDGSPLGVVRLEMDKTSALMAPTRCMNYDDLSVASEVAQRLVPHLLSLQEAELRRQRVTHLVHEMRVPVVTFRAALERLDDEGKRLGYDYTFDHFQEMEIYCDIMQRLVQNLEMTQIGRFPWSPRKLTMLAAVIAPAVRFIKPLMRTRRFKLDQIQRFKNLKTLPPIWLEPQLMTQVVFNLLDNALKYFRGPPENFWLEIEGSSTNENHEVAFRDKGIGIPPGYEDRIFERDARAPNALTVAQGDGLGLWLSRKIVRNHGGDLILRHAGGPTEFVIRLPRSLENVRPVASELGEDA